MADETQNGMGMGIVSLVFGLLAFFTVWVPYVGGGLGFVAIACASGAKHGLKTAGLVFGILALLGNIIPTAGCTYILSRVSSSPARESVVDNPTTPEAVAAPPSQTAPAKRKLKPKVYTVKEVVGGKTAGDYVTVAGYWKRGECPGGDYWLMASASDDSTGLCVRDENGEPPVAEGKRVRRYGFISLDSGDDDKPRLYVNKKGEE